jgi:hypothetical protein
MRKRKKLLRLLEEKPKVILPAQDEISRYVQTYILDKPILWCGSGESVCATGSTLNKILQEFDIDPPTRVQFRPGGAWHPVSKGRYYDVVGSGKCLLKESGGNNYEFLLSINTDEYQDYPLGVNWSHLESLRSEFISQRVTDIRLVKIDDFGCIKENLI